LVTEASKPQLEDSLRQFHAKISNDLRPQGAQLKLPPFSSRAIRPIGTIHFTLGVMSLMSEERVDAAINLLKTLDLSSMLLESLADQSSKEGAPSAEIVQPLMISLSSLVSMHDPKQTSILYATPKDPTERLYSLCSKLRSLFENEGYVVPENRPLKLHATIVNTVYAKTGGNNRPPRVKPKPDSSTIAENAIDGETESTKDSTDGADSRKDDGSGGHGPNARGSARFDATALIEEFEDSTWAKDFRLEKLAICRMGAKKITGPNGSIIGEEYEEVASIPMPM
jgi:activating signal cointegrator complex subunit 1